jgi:putative tryptophan/tyrosine transport system substrate-binding protein
LPVAIGRRELIAALGGAALWPLATRAQDRIRRIGVLMNFAANDTVQAARLAKFQEALEALGWIEGRNIHVETRWAHGDTDQVRKDAAELVALSPDVILATTTPTLTILERETKTVPIVFVSIVDPVGSRLVATMSRPGGNATGFVAFEYALASKWLELLKEVAPRVTRVAVLRDTSATGIGSFAAVQAVGSISMELSVIDLGNEMEQDVAAFAREPSGGLIVTATQFAANHPDLIVRSAARDNLPAIYPFRYFVDVGGLISYGPTLYDSYRDAAGYVDRILKGEKPAQLAVQAPTKYELVINLKTAKALGLTIPPTLLARADEVIE